MIRNSIFFRLCFKRVSFILFITVLFIQCKTKPTEESSGKDTTWALLPFVKSDTSNPVLTAGNNSFICPILKKEVLWDEKDVFNPAAVVKDGKIYLLFRAEDKIGKYAGTSRLGLASSNDGLQFTKMPEPVFYPDNDSMKIYEWEGGVEDPRVVESEDGRYILTYTAYDGNLARLCLATSTDLQHWTKHGLILQGKYKDTWSKSGAIVAKQQGEKIIAQKINGKYWMYFGDTDLFIATSEDLIHWQPLEENGKIKSVLKPRPGYFDSRLVESGPYALSTEAGILLLYNGMNLDEGGDTSLAKGAYCAGQALFDKTDPSKLIDRLEKNFLMPDKPYEITGQVNQVCFIEGLAPFKGKWFLYYGTADSKIAVAVREDVVK
ncbi:MAG TPA: glycoside hydrolase family 130 protein [Cyclobacteriaceae bacterium]